MFKNGDILNRVNGSMNKSRWCLRLTDEWLKWSILIELRFFFSGLLPFKTIIRAFKNLFHCSVMWLVMDSMFAQFKKKKSGRNLCHQKNFDEKIVVCNADRFLHIYFFFCLKIRLVSSFDQGFLANGPVTSQLPKYVFSSWIFWNVILNTAFSDKEESFQYCFLCMVFPQPPPKTIEWNWCHLPLLSTGKIRVWAGVVVEEFFCGNQGYLQW